MSNENNQMALFEYSDEAQIEAIKGYAAIEKRKDNMPTGELIGMVLSLGKRRDIAKSLGLEGKANVARLNKAILDMSDTVLKGVKSEIAALDSQDYTAHNTPVSVRRLADGRTVRTYKMVSVERDNRIDTAEIARQLGMDEETVIKAIEAKKAREALEAKNTVEAEATVTPDPESGTAENMTDVELEAATAPEPATV